MKSNKMVFICSRLRLGDGELDFEAIANHVAKNPTDTKVVAFLDKVRPLNENVVKKFLGENDEGKKLANSLFDARVTAAVKTHDDKFMTEKLPALLDEKVEALYAERHPEDDKTSKENRLLMERVKKLEDETNLNAHRNEALKVINDAKLPFAKIVDRLLGKDIAETTGNINALKSVWDSELEAAVQAVMGDENGRKPRERDEDPKVIEKQIEDAQKANNLPLVIKLKNKLQMLRASKK